MLMDQTMNILEKFVVELEKSEPEEREHLVKILIKLFELHIDTIESSPDFRRIYSESHSRLFKFPESKILLNEIFSAHERSFNDNEI